jgi:hypothetical protein
MFFFSTKINKSFCKKFLFNLSIVFLIICFYLIHLLIMNNVFDKLEKTFQSHFKQNSVSIIDIIKNRENVLLFPRKKLLTYRYFSSIVDEGKRKLRRILLQQNTLAVLFILLVGC